MAGRIDWSKETGTSTPRSTPSRAAPAAPAGSGRIDWSGTAKPAPSAGAEHHGQSFLGKIASGVKDAVEGLPAGLAQLGKDLGVTTVHAGENIINDVAGSHLGPATGWRDHGGLVASQQQVTSTLNDRPALR